MASREEIAAVIKDGLRISLSEGRHNCNSNDFVLRVALMFDGEEIDFDYITVNPNN